MLTTLSAVKARLKLATSDVVDDDLLTSFIAAISARFENDCNRTFGYGQQLDEFEGDETELRVSRYPIDASQAITFDLLTRQSEGWQNVVTAEYVLRRGCVISLLSVLGGWKQNLRVTFYGGFILPDADADQQAALAAAGVPALPDDLSGACVEQIAWLYQNKDRLGVVSQSGQGGAFSQFNKLDLLPNVQAVLDRYERYMP